MKYATFQLILGNSQRYKLQLTLSVMKSGGKSMKKKNIISVLIHRVVP